MTKIWSPWSFSEVYRMPDHYRLLNVSVQSAVGMPATAAVVMQVGGEERRNARALAWARWTRPLT